MILEVSKFKVHVKLNWAFTQHASQYVRKDMESGFPLNVLR